MLVVSMDIWTAMDVIRKLRAIMYQSLIFVEIARTNTSFMSELCAQILYEIMM